MNRQDFNVILGAALFGILVGLASLRGCPVEAVGEPAVAEDLKKRLLDEADLRRVHHEVYLEVGENEWEARVKPAFLRDITLAAARENDTLLPGIDEILEWVRTHPGEARALLRRHASRD